MGQKNRFFTTLGMGYANLLSTVPNSEEFGNKMKLLFSNFWFLFFLIKLS